MSTTHTQEIIQTNGRGTYDITESAKKFIDELRVQNGILFVFLAHTSASLILCENADPTVRKDLESFFSRLAPDGDRLFSHTAEGPDDMPAHVRSILTSNSLHIPVIDGKLVLGTWQGLYLFEHRIAPHPRSVYFSYQD